jgi:hypothetical protein
MSFNLEIGELTSAEVSWQTASYFEVLESVRFIGDTNKKYRPVTSVYYGSSTPFRVDTQTFVLISLNSEVVADWYNNYINIKMTLNLQISNNDGSTFIIPTWDAKYDTNYN